MIETIEYKGSIYPKLQAEGFAAQYAFPFAQKFCKGIGFDIGCMKDEWSYPGSIAIDPALQSCRTPDILNIDTDNFHCPDKIIFDAYNLPNCYLGEEINLVDYIFSSHCLEHLTDWVAALDYWATRIKSGGVLFLYLPNMDLQKYWQPQNNRKHKHYLNPTIIRNYFNNREFAWTNCFVTYGADLNASFYAIAEKI